MESSLHIYNTENQQKWSKGEKIMTPPSRGGGFYIKFSIEQLIAYFRSLWNILKYYFVAKLEL
jgi:hypothetical protein